MRDIVIIGGGLAGLINGICLAEAGLDVLLLEKKAYPFHRVCGEYISNEVIPFLESINAFPYELEPSSIREFTLTACSGASASLPLDLGGFGVSRHALDQFLYRRAKQAGVEVRQQTAVQSVDFTKDYFQVMLPQGEIVEAKIVIGAYGKRARLDKQMDRPFMQQRSPYIGVKYHVRVDFPDDVIALHNFPGGYCGISRVEDGRYNVCYLGSRAQLRKYGSIEALEAKVLHQNPYLQNLWHEAEFLFDQPEVINEISFAPKQPVVNHIFMSGDTAGLITPLCGNGMAMAIHSAKILSNLIIQQYNSSGFDRATLETQYATAWKRQFATRLWVGRHAQRLFGSKISSEIGVQLVKHWRSAGRTIMQYTHGEPF